MKRKLFISTLIVMVMVCALAVPAFAASGGGGSGSGNVSGAIESTWTAAAGQLKTIVNNVVFPAIDMILAIFFFVKLGTTYFDYRKHGQMEWAPPAILLACLIFTLTAPTYIWTIIGL